MKKIENDKFTIYEVEALYKQFIIWCNEAKGELSLDFEAVQKIDMAGIQLLLSAQKSCREKSARLTLENVPENILEALRIAGCEAYFFGGDHD